MKKFKDSFNKSLNGKFNFKNHSIKMTKKKMK